MHIRRRWLQSSQYPAAECIASTESKASAGSAIRPKREAPTSIASQQECGPIGRKPWPALYLPGPLLGVCLATPGDFIGGRRGKPARRPSASGLGSGPARWLLPSLPLHCSATEPSATGLAVLQQAFSSAALLLGASSCEDFGRRHLSACSGRLLGRGLLAGGFLAAGADLASAALCPPGRPPGYRPSTSSPQPPASAAACRFFGLGGGSGLFGRGRFLLGLDLGQRLIDDPQEIELDVVPGDIVISVELDQCPAAHVDRLDRAGDAGKPLQLRPIECRPRPACPCTDA